mmetsp:Transcript_56481/g.82880  ORF Transcript_56481/g.82880 Transcript_56481/m.82880 type:complete len:881 (+) Transcript_56481:448-3090(+)
MHFASVAYVQESLRHPDLYFWKITEATKILTNALIRNGVRKIIYSSTCAVYGNPAHLPIDESTLLDPISPYGQAKLKAEEYLKKRSSSFFQVYIVRYFNVIGSDPLGRIGEVPHASTQNYSRLWTACVRTAFGEQQYVSVHGSGVKIRDYVHVWDVVRAHAVLMSQFPLFSSFEISNIGTGRPISTMEFIETFRKVTNVFVPVKFVMPMPGNPPKLFSSGGKIFESGIWKPELVNLSTTFLNTWKYTLKHKSLPDALDKEYAVCIVGGGLSAAVLAERHSTVYGHSVLILEKRQHIGGNCYDEIEVETGIRVSKYGVHLFHTRSKRVWDDVQNFSEWSPWEHRVVAKVGEQFVPVPVNIKTVNLLFDTNLTTTDDMRKWLQGQQVVLGHQPKNSEEVGLQRVGRKLYELLLRPYTVKQWEKDPKDLDPSVVGRIPVRDDLDDRYFTDPYQALPSHGYTRIFENIFALPGITVMLNTDFFDVRHKIQCGKLYYTGPIDAYFAHEGLDKLEYRSLTFNKKVFYNTSFFQPTSQVNYPSLRYNFTRVVEYKHLLNQKSKHTVVYFEHSSSFGDPYYPVPNSRNTQLYARYQQLSAAEKNVSFVGRLANYKYFNMDQTILNALELFDNVSLTFDNASSNRKDSPIVHNDPFIPSRQIVNIARGGTFPNTTDLIVAHCREKLSWISEWVDKIKLSNVYIYSKCGGSVPDNSSVIHVIHLMNKGREGQSQLHHLLRSDITFANQNVFVQGSPEASVHDVLLKLKNGNHAYIDFNTHNNYFYSFPGCLTSGQPHKGFEEKLRASYKIWKMPDSKIPLEKIRCTLRGEFLVLRKDIQDFLVRHGRKRLLQLKAETEKSNAPVVIYVLERLWGTLFSSHSKDLTLAGYK